MFLSQFLIACCCLFFSAWLFWSERRGWPGEKFDSELDLDYFARRGRSRSHVSVMFFLCGLLVLGAAIAGKGRFFIAAWTTVAFVLMVVMMFALLDVIRTQNYEKKKRRELRESTLKNAD